MKNLTLLLIALAIFTGCKKEVSELPASTQTGANTFGAKVNGQFWVPQGFGVVPTSSILEARYGGGNSVFINARNFSSSPTETEFELYLQNVTGPGTYLLNQPTGKYPSHSGSYGYYVERKFTPKNEWITNSQYTGKIEVSRYDVTNNIISGTFEFQAINLSNSPQPITVTEGRFDVTIQ
ncbi:MAG: DUF6252 family protein [Chitinophagaceae bacterium]